MGKQQESGPQAGFFKFFEGEKVYALWNKETERVDILDPENCIGIKQSGQKEDLVFYLH